MKKFVYKVVKVNPKSVTNQRKIVRQIKIKPNFSQYTKSKISTFKKLDQQIKELNKLKKNVSIIKKQHINYAISLLQQEREKAFRNIFGLKKDFSLSKRGRKKKISHITSDDLFEIELRKKRELRTVDKLFNDNIINNLEEYMQESDKMWNILADMGGDAYWDALQSDSDRRWTRRIMNKQGVSSQITATEWYKWNHLTFKK